MEKLVNLRVCALVVSDDDLRLERFNQGFKRA
jgi:hypothetical protein